MNGIGVPVSFRGGTSAGGTPVTLLVLVADCYPFPNSTGHSAEVPRVSEGTVAPVSARPEQLPDLPVSEAVLEIRRRSGLTWDQVAHALNVSRRSVHHWANGQRVAKAHEQLVLRVLKAIRELDSGNQEETLRRLIDPIPEAGACRLELIRLGRFEEARSGVADFPPVPERPALTPLSAEAVASRRPQPPLQLLGAKHDRLPAKSRGRVLRIAGSSKKES